MTKINLNDYDFTSSNNIDDLTVSVTSWGYKEDNLDTSFIDAYYSEERVKFEEKLFNFYNVKEGYNLTTSNIEDTLSKVIMLGESSLFVTCEYRTEEEADAEMAVVEAFKDMKGLVKWMSEDQRMMLMYSMADRYNYYIENVKTTDPDRYLTEYFN